MEIIQRWIPYLLSYLGLSDGVELMWLPTLIFNECKENKKKLLLMLTCLFWISNLMKKEYSDIKIILQMVFALWRGNSQFGFTYIKETSIQFCVQNKYSSLNEALHKVYAAILYTLPNKSYFAHKTYLCNGKKVRIFCHRPQQIIITLVLKYFGIL